MDHPLRRVRRLRQQIRWLLRIFPHHLCLIQIGCYFEAYGWQAEVLRQATGLALNQNWRGFPQACGFPQKKLLALLSKLKQQRLPVIVVQETGRFLLHAKERSIAMIIEYPENEIGQSTQIEPPRIFISHAWEDKTLVRQLEKALADAGAEVWVDHAGIRGGDNLPERINEALEWCNTLLLVWSKPAKASHWVKLEWTNAISLRKLIIPCPVDGTPVPPIMANTAYIDFSNHARGLQELLKALQLVQTGALGRETGSELASVIHARLTQTAPPTIPKPPQDEPTSKKRKKKRRAPKPVQPARPSILHLRQTPLNPLSVETVQQMLREKNFFDAYDNKSGEGIRHQYEFVEQQGAPLVIDHVTGLMWQKGGSENLLPFKDAEAYVQQLNAKKFGGYNDWHLPTLEEAMSLMEREKKNDDLYIDPVFDRTQRYIWTADKESAGRAWDVSFYDGCYHFDIGYDYYVRAVRSGQSII